MIRKLSEREHLLTRANMYIGAINSTKSNEYILENDKIEYKEVQYVPGLIKIINEIIDNSVDVAIKTNFKSSNEITIKMVKDYVQVTDNGTGIPVIKNPDGHYLPELAWGHARAGSNFDDDENRTQIGLNGVGSFATNCFSKKFIGQTDDGKNQYTIEFKDNASTFKESVKPSNGDSGTAVKFYPDLERFGLTEIDDNHVNIIKQRLLNLSLSFPDITFKFNGKKININSFKKYVSLFNETSEIIETEDYRFAILPNDEDDFRQFSYVNGLKIPDGGTHIDYIVNNVVTGIREKLMKKYRTIRPGDIKNKLMIVAFLKNMKNTKFNSQSKEKITNSIGEIASYYGKIDFDKLNAKLLRNKNIIDPITEVYRIKEEFKKRQELKALNKTVKKIKSDKYYPATANKKYLLLTEGECLNENTKIMMSDYSTKTIKDIELGDKIISGDLTTQEVTSKTKMLKESLTFNTPSGEIVCGYKHKLKVFDKEDNDFKFITAEVISKDKQRYMFLKSKLNADTTALKVLKNNINSHVLELDNGYISYTDDDNFVIIRNKMVLRIHSLEIKEDDLILMSN